MTPEERRGIEALVASGIPDEATAAWLKHHLEADDWDKQIERMGGGKKARDAYMKPIFDATCAVTAFDMHAQLMGDGRERGLWVWLYDNSKMRGHNYDNWAEGALEEFCQLAGVKDETKEKFRLSMSMDRFKNVSNYKVDHAALLEWPAVKKMYKVIGAAIAAHDAKEKKERAEEVAQSRSPRRTPGRSGQKERRPAKGRARRRA